MRDLHEFQVRCALRHPQSALATSGQVFIHDVLRGLSPSNGHTNFEIGFFIPRSTLFEVETKLRLLLQEVESLRTIWFVDEDGRLLQHLLTEMSVVIRITDEAPSFANRNTYRVLQFAQGELPIRPFLYVGGEEWYLSLVVSHLSIDKWGRDVLEGHLQRLFLGTDRPPATAWHPIDQSLFEQSEVAQRVQRQSEAYWRSTLGQFPASIVTGARVYSAHSHWWRVQLNSPSLGSAVTRLAGRIGVSSSIVALTLGAVVIGAWFNIGTFHTMMLSANRFDRRYGRAVGVFAQTVPIALGTNADTFAQLARLNFGTTMQAYRHAAISPYVSAGVIAELKAAGTPKQLDTMVNVYILGDGPAAPNALPSDTDDARITWIQERDSEITNVSFDCSEPGMALLQADTRYIPKDDIERLLRLYRSLALQLATGDDGSPRDLADRLLASAGVA